MGALIGVDSTANEVRRRASSARLHAPHLIDAEVGQILRGKVRCGEVSEPSARGYLRAINAVVAERYPHRPVAEAAWDLRGSVSFYHALYVALAARLNLPLLTTDSKLTNTPTGLPCEVAYVAGPQQA